MTPDDLTWKALTDDWEAASTGSLDFEDGFDCLQTEAGTATSAHAPLFSSAAEEGTAALTDPLAAWAASGYIEHLAAVLHPRGSGMALAESNPGALADAIRVVIALARRSLTIAASIAGVRTKVSGKPTEKKSLLGSIVELTLQQSAPVATACTPATSPRVQAIRLLRVVCCSGQALARTCASQWMLGAAKRPILEWIGGKGGDEVCAAAAESFALWQACIGYGLDVSAWVDLSRDIKGRAAAAVAKGGLEAVAACMSWKVAGAVVEAAVRGVESSR